jgi:hypothetical protein
MAKMSNKAKKPKAKSSNNLNNQTIANSPNQIKMPEEKR